MLNSPTPEVIAGPACRLGESPVWDPAGRALWWIDVWGRALHRLSLADDALARWELPALPGCVLPVADGRLLVALADGLCAFDPSTGSLESLGSPPPSGGRYNDGFVDRAGQLWIGTVESSPGAADGALYRWSEAGGSEPVVAGLATPNGLALSPDGGTLYFTVTERRQILAYDVDPASGRLSERGPVVTDTDCYPDGLVVSADGTLWSAKWDGWRVSRYAPDGRLLDEIGFPVPNVTSLTFGGPAHDRLFVTTASEDTVRTSPGREADAGRLFVVDGTGAVGQPDTVLDRLPLRG